MNANETTFAPVKAGDLANRDPEFVRVPQLYPLAGIKRGLAYRKIRDGTFRSVLLREPGNVSGCRLVFWPSVKAYLHGLMKEQGTVEATHAAQRQAA
jgi:hypothetical protein